MSYLHFDKTLMTNLEEALQKEVLRTNRSGAYHCTTIVDCNTRKYHGLLVMPVPELDDENHVLLSSLDETVIQHGAEFNLGLHKYSDDNYSPRGHKYIREFDYERGATTWFRVGGVVLKKERLLVHHENRILIQYTLVEARSQTKLRLKPYLAFRSVRQYTHKNEQANRHYDLVQQGIKTSLYPGYPELYMQLSKENRFEFMPDWYMGIEYPKEQERGYDFNEDLYVPGYFEVEMRKGETITFSAGVAEVDTTLLHELFHEEMESRTPRTNFKHCLVNSAHQFYSKQGEESYVLAGYPWFKCRARDLFVSLPGLMLSLGEVKKFEGVMETALKAVRAFMNGTPCDLKIYEIEKPDVLLWAIWALQQYAKTVSVEACLEKYGTLIREMILFIMEQKHPNLELRENGLVYTHGKTEVVTWMNSVVNGLPVIPRTGYVVEINALWYNALRFVTEFFPMVELPQEVVEQHTNLMERCGAAFVETFLNEHGYLFDYVETYGDQDWSVRPNMIFAAAFDYSPLSPRQQKAIIDIATKELLTPKGIRSLSPKSSGYNPNYVGTQMERDYAYHQGTAWPWLAGFYFEAYLKIHKRSGVGFVERQLIGYEAEMSAHCIGTMAELFDGNPPFKGRGAVSFAMNVAEILRTLYNLDTYNE